MTGGGGGGASMILLTRPEADTPALVRALAARGLVGFAEPMLAIAPLPLADLGPLHAARALAFSSARAPPLLAAAAPCATTLPAYAVGGKTAAAARAAGWRVVDTTDTGAALAPRLPPGTLHARGRHAATPLGGLPPLILYEARAATALSPEGVRHIRGGDISHALFFSARAAGRFVRLARAAGLTPALARITALCLSPRVVHSSSPGLWARVVAPARPRMKDMLDLIL